MPAEKGKGDTFAVGLYSQATPVNRDDPEDRGDVRLRRVALKVLPPAIGLTQEARRRFEREAQVDAAAVVDDAQMTDSGAGDPEAWITYGTALYRAARYDEAREALFQAVEIAKAESPYDQFVLSMVSFRLGDRRQARIHYDRAVTAMDPNGSANPIWINYRREASRLLGIE